MRCKICGKKLCIYNETGECYHHNEVLENIKEPHKCCCSSGVCGIHAQYTQMLEQGFTNKIKEDILCFPYL